MGLIDAYVNDDIIITGRGSTDGYGAYDHTGTVTVTRARVVEKSGIRKGADGTDWLYAYKVYLSPSDTVALHDKITFNSTDYEIRDLEKHDDINGTFDHWVAYVG